MNSIVVGGTSGIGHGLALHLAKASTVHILGRSQTRADNVLSELKSISHTNNHKFTKVDASLLSSIKISCDTLAEQYKDDGIQTLILSQGIATMQGRTETTEAIDEKLALHYYGRMYYIQLLLPLLLKSKTQPRILSVLSAGVHSPYVSYKTDPSLKSNYSIKNAADAAGYYTDLMLNAYAKEYPQIIFAHAAPGFVNSNWGTEMPWGVKMLLRPLKSVFGRDIKKCGTILADALVKKGSESGGGVVLIDSEGRDVKYKWDLEAEGVIVQHTKEVLSSYK
jgi:NAD(P)-dependent dehydrogenase (short-subunit alcohol dehydrogenase family)